MSDWLWRNEAVGLGLRREAAKGEERLIVYVDGERRGVLSSEAAGDLAQVLRRWSAVPVDVPLGVSFEIYYVHEYADEEGRIVPCPALGMDHDEFRYTYSEPDIGAVRRRVAQIGEAVAALHARQVGSARAERSAELGRAWISVFRMPEDVRVWKGFWDELDEVPDGELLD